MNGAAVFCQNSDGKVLLGRRNKEPMLGSWILPGGHILEGERGNQAAIREFLEETGILCEVEVPSEHFEILDGRTVYFFRAKSYKLIEGNFEDDELLDARWCSAEEAKALELTPLTKNALTALWPEFSKC